jgi:glycosyltransferase involved in cell wall biosynthesis
VPEGDEAAFQEALARLLSTPDLRAHYAQAGRERAKHYAPERILPKWEALLAEVAASV